MSATTVASAVTTDELEPSQAHRVAAIEFSGNQTFSANDLEAVMATKTRPFYALWQKHPEFNPATFSNDLTQLKLFYESRGYYDVQISYGLSVAGSQVTPHITIKEGQTVKVDAIAIDVTGAAPRPQQLQPGFALPLRPGQVFTQPNYQLGQQNLLNVYRQNGYARADVNRHAVVRTGPRLAWAAYRVTPGVRAIFGRTTVSGSKEVDPKVILRELAYKAGQRFDSRKIEQSRTNILNLNLFSAVAFTLGDDPHGPRVVPITIAVHEKAAHSLTLGLGYNTQTLLNAQLAWNDYNFLGDGRQLLISGTYSEITDALDIKLIQPHFFSRDARLVAEAEQAQESYQTYQLNASRFIPHIDYTFSPSLNGSIGCRFGYLKFNQVNPATIGAIGGFRRNGLVSGPNASVIFNNTSDLLDPQHGEILSLQGDVSDHALGADYRYWSLMSETRKYQPIGAKTASVSFSSRMPVTVIGQQPEPASANRL